MEKSNIQLHTNKYSTKLTCCQVYNRPIFIIALAVLFLTPKEWGIIPVYIGTVVAILYNFIWMVVKNRD